MDTSKDKAIEFLGQLPIFAELPPSDLVNIADHLEKRTYRRGAVVYHTQDTSDTVYFLTRGVVKISSESEDGREIIKQVLHPYALFGEMCLVGQTHRKNDAVCMNAEVVLYEIPAAILRRVLFGNPRLSERFLQWIGKRLQRTEARLEAMVFKDARARIIDFLREAARRQGRRVGYEMLIKHCLTQQDIANLTGTSRQTVTAVFNELKKANLIYFNRRSILIRDVAKLS